jgi:hypothetical protein
MVGEALFETLKIKVGEAAAKKLLGIDKQQGNTKYTFGMPFTGGKLQIDPMRMIANQGIRSIASGGGSGIMAPALLFGGSLALGYARNPLRPGSMNYNPELQGQLDYLSSNSMIDRNNSFNSLRYNKNSILNNQNVVSLFGTNDYGKQLQKYRDKYKDTMPEERLERLDREIFDQITDDFDQTDKFIAQQTPVAKKAPAYVPSPADNGGGGGNFASQNTGTNENFSNTTGRGRTGYVKGGIASL